MLCIAIFASDRICAPKSALLPDLGAQILSEANIAIHSINNLSDAANKAVELAK